MRILMVIPRLGKGGAEKLTCDTVIEMQKRPGVTVKVVCFDKVSLFPELTDQIDLQPIPSNVQLSIFRKNKYDLDEYVRFLNEFKPDIIHSHLFESEIITRSVYYPSAKYFTHCHDNMAQFKPFKMSTLFNKKKLFDYYEREYIFRRYLKNGGNRFLCISNYNYQYFEKVLPQKLSNITLLPNAIKFNQYNSINHQRPLNEINLVSTGNFKLNKNQAFLVDVLNCMKQKGVTATLTLMGQGPTMQDVKNRAKQYGLENQVRFEGAVGNVEDYLKRANLYVHAANYETFGLSLIEAMAAGLPVVTTDGSGNRDIVKDGINGILITDRRPEIFADKVLALMKDPARYERMSKEAVEYARQFDIKNYVDRLLDLYAISSGCTKTNSTKQTSNPKKALLISTEFLPAPGGIGSHAYALASGLTKKGWEITVATEQNYSADAEIESFNRRQYIRIIRILSTPSLALFLQKLFTLCRLALTSESNLIIGTGKHGSWFAYIVARLLFKKCALIGHGTEFTITFTGKRTRFVNKWVYSHADLLVCVSNYTKTISTQERITNGNNQVIHNGADSDIYYKLPAAEIARFKALKKIEDQKIIVTIGNISDRKGQEWIIRAMPEILKTIPNAYYYCMGFPKIQQQLIALANELEISSHVHFLGRLPNEELRNWLNASDVFGMTSVHTRGDFEGFGIAVIEAALCGKCSVVTNQSGLVEAVIDNVTGFTVPERDTAAIAKAIISLLVNDQLLKKMSDAAYNRANNEFTWNKQIEKYTALLEPLVEPNKKKSVNP